jgi:hypothetical protein
MLNKVVIGISCFALGASLFGTINENKPARVIVTVESAQTSNSSIHQGVIAITKSVKPLTHLALPIR